MTIENTWTFGPLEYEDKGANVKAVTVIHWQVSGTDGTHDGRAIGTFSVGEPGDPFTAFDDLTPEAVKGWIDDDVITQAEAAVALEIARKADDATSNKGSGVPW